MTTEEQSQIDEGTNAFIRLVVACLLVAIAVVGIAVAVSPDAQPVAREDVQESAFRVGETDVTCTSQKVNGLPCLVCVAERAITMVCDRSGPEQISETR
jgi:hypothetical protein